MPIADQKGPIWRYLGSQNFAISRSRRNIFGDALPNQLRFRVGIRRFPFGRICPIWRRQVEKFRACGVSRFRDLWATFLAGRGPDNGASRIIGRYFIADETGPFGPRRIFGIPRHRERRWGNSGNFRCRSDTWPHAGGWIVSTQRPHAQGQGIIRNLYIASKIITRN